MTHVYAEILLGASPAVTSTWKVDLTPPKTTITSVTPAGSLINTGSVSVQFTVSESATSYCSVDGSSPSACASPFAPATLADGAHTRSRPKGVSA